MKILNIRIVWSLIICNFFCETNCWNDGELDFERTAKLPEVKMRELDVEVIYFVEPEDRQKLCFYAAIKAKLPYVDYNYASKWSRYSPPLENYNNNVYHYVLPCQGIPDFYLLRRGNGGERIQITFLHSSDVSYELGSNISMVTSVKRRDDEQKKFKETEAAKMDIRVRKSLCTRASIYITNVALYFLDKNVDEACSYEFKYENKTETGIAISCPTSPALYIRFGSSKNTAELVLHKSGIDLYEFEEDKYEPLEVSLAYGGEESNVTSDSLSKLSPEDQLKLCTLARKRHILSTFVEDKEVTEAKFYSFQYAGEQKKQNNWAILCPATPTLYLQLVGKNKIKFTSITPKSVIHISGVKLVETVFKTMREINEEDHFNLKNHSFNKQLDANARRDICYIAQKYIMDAGSKWKFRFTQKETVLEPYKLLLIPNYIGDPDVYQIRYMKDIYEYEEEIVYMCTRWPEMYIRRKSSDGELEILLISREVI